MDVIYTLFACDQWKNGAKVEVLKLPLDISHLCLAGLMRPIRTEEN